MERYDSYKDSGVDWIGEIPSHWIVRRNKYFTSQRKDKSETGDEDLLSVSEYHGVVPRRVIRDGEEHLSRSESFEGYLMVSPGELVSNIMLMWKTGLGVSQYEGLVSPAYSVFQFSDGLPKYFHYLFRTSQYTSEYRRNSTGVIESRLRLYDDSFGRLSSHFPPLQEQEQIVEYLDKKTTLIDSLIEKTVRKVELLKEKRTSLINEVVTKGLNPDVEMKDSGVEWIGEIPSHWEVSRIKFYLNGVIDTEHKTVPFQEDGAYYVVRTSNIRGGRLNLEGCKMTDLSGFNEWTVRGVPEPGDVLLTREGPVGECCVIPEDVSFCMGQRVVWLKIQREKINAHFLVHVIYSVASRIFMENLSIGSTVSHLNMSEIGNIPILYCSVEEQEQIVEYLDKQTSIIDSTIATEEKRIELLKEYRQSLISEVVTGKVKVTRDE